MMYFMYPYEQFYRQCPTGTTPYIIRAGDTLSRIARQFGTTVQAIVNVNPGINPDILRIGQQICVPVAGPAEPSVCPAGSIPYTVRAGDTLARIAQQYNTTVQAIININPGINPNSLRIGQRLCIPQNPPVSQPACPQSNFYVIAAGDTLYSIARNFNVTVAGILRLNPGLNPNALQVNQVICIPVAPSPYSISVDKNILRLTLYRDGRTVKTYPVAVGKPATPTPEGTFTIVNKQVDPGGPFGTRWMGLSVPHYGIHGTSNPASIGRMASNGCVRMLNSNVNELFNYVPVGTIVRIFS